MIATFNRFTLTLTKAEARSLYHQGACDDDVAAALCNPTIQRRLARISPDLIRAELREYGAWDEDELADDAANQSRLLWLAAGNVVEGV